MQLEPSYWSSKADETMKKLPITVCIISGAEERRIGRTLESVAGWVSEIVVVLNEDVDDRTEEIARGYGAKVWREPWKGDTGQKQSAASKACQEWILGLDADEVVSPELVSEIEKVFADADRLGGFAGFTFPRMAMFYGRWIRHGDWYPDRVTRLWRKDLGGWEGRTTHGHVSVRGKVGKLRSNLLHYTMEDLEHMVRKTLVYSDAFAEQASAEGRHVTVADMWFRPVWRFVRAYFLRLGFLDGWRGYVIAWMGAFYTFLRYTKVRLSDQTGERKA